MAAKPALTQLNHYLGRAWIRAGIPIQSHADCNQAVYARLLERLGRNRFDLILAAIDHHGISDALSGETADGPEFFRVIDTVKKRAQRERRFQSLESVFAVPAITSDHEADLLHDAIRHALSPREAALIHATLQGRKPAEIASEWGNAPKTISNEKTQAIRKLRAALTS